MTVWRKQAKRSKRRESCLKNQKGMRHDGTRGPAKWSVQKTATMALQLDSTVKNRGSRVQKREN